MPEFSLLRREPPEHERNLAKDIREKGWGDDDVKKQMLAWKEEQERWSDDMGIKRARVEVALREGEIFKDAGYYEGAWRELNWASYAAKQEGAYDISEYAETLMDEMDNEMSGKE